MIGWRNVCYGLLAAFAAGTGGCTYTVRFQPEEIINAAVDPENGHPLEIDIVCLTNEDHHRRPELFGLRADEWFKRKENGEFTNIAKKIYSLRDSSSEAGATRQVVRRALKGQKHEPPPRARQGLSCRAVQRQLRDPHLCQVLDEGRHGSETRAAGTPSPVPVSSAKHNTCRSQLHGAGRTIGGGGPAAAEPPPRRSRARQRRIGQEAD